MNDTTLAQQMVAAAPAATRNVNLSTDPKRLAIINLWDAMFRGPALAKDLLTLERAVVAFFVQLPQGSSLARNDTTRYLAPTSTT